MSLEAELFKLLNKREYPAALTLLQQSPNLDINALNDEGGSLFMEAVMNKSISPERYAFIETLLIHSDFKHANTPYEDATATPFKLAAGGHQPVVMELILKYKESKNIDVLFHNPQKLMYEEHTQRFTHLKKSVEEEPDRYVEATFPDRKKVMEILLHLTVHHAIKTDDTSLLQRLVDAGANLYYPLKDGTYPMDLVKDKPELAVHQWLSEYIKQQISSNPTFTLAAHSLARQHGEREQELVAKHIEKTSEAIKRTFKFFDYKEQLLAQKPKQPEPTGNSVTNKSPGQ
jgi:hypothetical protein